MNRDQERAIEWDCVKVLWQYYALVDHYEYDQAVELFTTDIDWLSLGVHLKGRKELLDGLHGGLERGTIRHVLTNTIVTVVDENHAKAQSYNVLFSSPDQCIDTQDKPIAVEGPNLILDMSDELKRTEEGWKISRRRARTIFKRNPDKPVPLQNWYKTDMGQKVSAETAKP